MAKKHDYKLVLSWTGNQGNGTSSYTGYDRSFNIEIKGKVILLGSSDPSFRGDITKHNPEELFLASLSSCHMLWYLHLCSEAGIVVLEYSDTAKGTMNETLDGVGQFTYVTLQPNVIVSENKMIPKANKLHKLANQKCFIANSCNFPVEHIANCKTR